MNAVIQLSDKELKAERERLFEEKRKDVLTVLDALNTHHDWHAHYVARDMLPCQEEIDRALWRLLEKSGDFELAEIEAIGRKGLE